MCKHLGPLPFEDIERSLLEIGLRGYLPWNVVVSYQSLLQHAHEAYMQNRFTCTQCFLVHYQEALVYSLAGYKMQNWSDGWQQISINTHRLVGMLHYANRWYDAEFLKDSVSNLRLEALTKLAQIGREATGASLQYQNALVVECCAKIADILLQIDLTLTYDLFF